MKSNQIITIIISIIFFAACTKTSTTTKYEKQSRVNQLPYYEDATFKPYWLNPTEEIANDFHQISPFNLINQDGEPITEKTFEGKIYVTDFFFTICPGICTKMTTNMSILQEEFKEDDEVFLLSHSVTPKTDIVPVLKAYAKEKGVISGKWHLVTGNQKEIYKAHGIF